MKQSAAQYDSAPSRVGIRSIRGLVDCAEQAGIPRRALLLAAALDTNLLESNADSVEGPAAHRLVEAILDLSDDPAFGLHWAQRQNVAAVSPISYLVAHANTLREGFEVFSRFHRLVSDQQSFYLEEERSTARLICVRLPGLSLRAQRMTSDMLTSCMFKLIRAHGPAERTEQVSFEYPAPSYRHEYAKVFDQMPRFEHSFTGIEFDRVLLSRASPHRDHTVHSALVAVAENELSRVTSQPTCSARVCSYLVEHGAAPTIRMSDVAHALGMSQRSLSRHLMNERRPYKEIEQEAQAVVAQQYIRDPQLSIQEAAFKMGFAHPSAFYRAFKRWTGTTPTDFRQQLAAGRPG